MTTFGNNLLEVKISKENLITEAIDYVTIKNNFTGARFLRECCIKLNANIVTMCTAATYYHKFFSVANFDDYDPYLIASTCIYLSSKLRNEDLKIRDIVNVSYNCIHRKDTPLPLDPYFDLRDSLVEAELILMRMLGFDLSVDLPHKHMLLYITAIKDWIGNEEFEKVPIIQKCWAILLDSYHIPIALAHSPQLLAGSIISLVMQIYGIVIPGCREVNDMPWYSSLHPDCTQKNVWNLCTVLIKMYDADKQLKGKVI